MRVVGLAVEHLDLRPQDRQRRAQLVRRVGDEVALARERALQPCEHPVEGAGQHADLAAGADAPGAQREVAGVDGRRDVGHAPQTAGRSASRSTAPRRPRAGARATPPARRSAAGCPARPGRCASGSAICSVPTRRPWSLIGSVRTRSRPASATSTVDSPSGRRAATPRPSPVLRGLVPAPGARARPRWPRTSGWLVTGAPPATSMMKIRAAG